MALLDKDIREPLFQFLEQTYHRIRIIEEKNMGRSRADILMVTEGALYGIEIKSDHDSYTRLSRQVDDYDRFFDYNFAAVGSSHAGHIEEHIPDYWGIITIDEVDGKPDFYILRRPQRNPRLDPSEKIRILWRPELAHIQELNDMPAYRNKSKLFVEQKILERVPPDVLRVQLSDELFEREYTTIRERINAYRTANGRKPRRRRRVRRKRYKSSM